MADNANQSGSPNISQFENQGIVGRYEYVNTGGRLTTGSHAGGTSTEIYNAYDPRQRGVGANVACGYPAQATGIYSAFPMMSPKYVRHPLRKTAGQMSGLARMYIPVGGPKAVERIINNFERRGDPQLVAVARQLLGESAGKENTGKGYLDFILQGVSQSLDEKYQVSEVLEDNYAVFFFGQRAPIWSFSGSLMNTYQDDWTMNMLRLYSELGRGSQLAKRGLLLHIRYDSLIVGGCMLNFRWDLTSSNELFAPFSFNFLVRSRTILRGSKNIPTKLPDYYANFYDTQLNRADASYMATITQAEKDDEINSQVAQSPEATSVEDLSMMTPEQQLRSISTDAIQDTYNPDSTLTAEELDLISGKSSRSTGTQVRPASNFSSGLKSTPSMLPPM